MRKLFTFLLALAASVGASHAAPAVAVNGKLPGAFSVSASKKVNFSQGNLRATTADKGTTWTWAFAADQLTFVGKATANTAINGNGTVSANGTVDLFGWSTAATKYGINNSLSNSTYSGDFVDWGSNPDLIASLGKGWRTLTSAEWTYLLNTRTTTSGVRYAKATVDGKTGLIVLPDDWSESYHALASANTDNVAYTYNTFDAAIWSSDFEAHGAVFLPAAGYRLGTSVEHVGVHGNYWSASPDGANYAWYLAFHESHLLPAYNYNRVTGEAVRLVSDIPQYTITFQNYDGTTLQSSKVYLNAIPAYTGDTPEKPSTAAYSYTFSGWSPTIAKATANATYTAQFSQAPNQATVDDVIAKINAIGEVAYTTECKAKIDVARNAYNALTDEQKALVSNYATLEAAEARYAYLTPVVITPNEDPKNAGTYYSTYYDGNRLLMLPENVEAYVAYVQGDALMMQLIAESGDILPKATPVIFRSEEEHFTLLPQDEGAVDMSEVENALQGSDIIAPAPANTYVLSGTAEYGVGFYRINSENLKAHKAYVVLAGLQNNAPRRLRFVFNEEKVATGVENTDASAKIGGSEKVIENGVLYIIKNGVKYNAQGQIVK
jgi:hypothetical protein